MTAPPRQHPDHPDFLQFESERGEPGRIRSGMAGEKIRRIMTMVFGNDIPTWLLGGVNKYDAKVN